MAAHTGPVKNTRPRKKGMTRIGTPSGGWVQAQYSQENRGWQVFKARRVGPVGLGPPAAGSPLQGDDVPENRMSFFGRSGSTGPARAAIKDPRQPHQR